MSRNLISSSVTRVRSILHLAIPTLLPPPMADNTLGLDLNPEQPEQPADDTEPSQDPPSQSPKPREPKKPYVNPDRVNTGGPQRVCARQPLPSSQYL